MTVVPTIALTGGLFVLILVVIWAVLRTINFWVNYTPPLKQVPLPDGGLGWFCWALIIMGVSS